jgi:hypothetical protein
MGVVAIKPDPAEFVESSTQGSATLGQQPADDDEPF